MVDQVCRLRAMRDGAELVQRAARREPASGLGRQVHPVKSLPVTPGLVRRQGAAKDQEPLPVELRASRRQVRGRDARLVRALCCARHASPALGRTYRTKADLRDKRGVHP
jgi:hypothetical protein